MTTIFDSVITHVNHRWLINSRPPLTRWYERLTLPLRRESIDDRQGWVQDLKEIRKALQKLMPDDSRYPPETADPELVLLRYEVLDLEVKCGPQENLFRIDPIEEDEPKLTGTELLRVPEEDAFTLVLEGTHLEKVNKVILGGKEATYPAIIDPAGQRIVVSFPKGKLLTQNAKPCGQPRPSSTSEILPPWRTRQPRRFRPRSPPPRTHPLRPAWS